MMFEYDTWNRVQRIVYPDSEVVTYNYDLAGNLIRVHTYKANHRDTLIKNILYDEFGHRTQVNFGNGVTTNYTYDILQRLSLLETKKPSSPALQKISYSFDLEDNITQVRNTTGPVNGIGGAYVNTYNYDDLYRLTAANGSYSGNNTNYSLEMAYTPAGRLCSKLQDFTATGNIYAYSTNNKPHAARRIYNGITNELSNLRWDNNGNLAQQTVYSVNNNTTNYQTMRMLFWDEDDRLNLVAGDGYLSYYAYGHDGNRAIKMTGNAAIDQTGTLLNSTNLENITIYPNEYLTVTQAEYTKYYYAGGNRIASKIGTGGFEKMTRLCTYDANITYNANTLLNFVLYQITNPTNQANDEYPVYVCGGYNVATELLTTPLPTLYITQANLNFMQANLLQQFRQNLTNSVEPVYYFHSDHLGSANWISDGTGAAVQHLQYLPFGEHFVNEQSSGYFERFTFTGKERDAETGYYYHGARFNSSDIGWLSVDPMSYKYPEITPYHYCHWNPIKLVDKFGLFDTEKEANKYRDKAIKKFGLDRVGAVFNNGTSDRPNYSFHLYNKGKDNKTHGLSDKPGVWAYRPDATIGDFLSFYKYSFKQRLIGFSFRLSLGGQCSSEINIYKKFGIKGNLSSIDLFSYSTEFSQNNGWSHNTYFLDNTDLHGNRGIGFSIGWFKADYNSSYTAIGESINEESKVNTGSISFLSSSDDGQISLGINISIVIGVEIQLFSRYEK